MIAAGVAVLIAIIVIMVLLSRMGTRRKKEAIADLDREREQLRTPSIVELVEEEVREAGIAELPGAAGIDPVILLKVWKRDGPACPPGTGHFTVAENVGPDKATEDDVTFACPQSDDASGSRPPATP
jgi:hypothetical protein